MKPWLTTVLAALLALSTALATVVAQTPTADAQRSVETWLALTDAANYDGSWDTAGSYFKSQVSLEQWNQAIRGAREPLGALQSRSVKSATPANSLPGAPDGEYVVFEFDTSFERKAEGVETVTAVQETDGMWRVVGYFIR